MRPGVPSMPCQVAKHLPCRLHLVPAGVSTRIGRPAVPMVALHKDGYSFPVSGCLARVRWGGLSASSGKLVGGMAWFGPGQAGGQ